MASSLEFVQFVAEQFAGAGTVTYKRMFGEFGLYFGGKYFAAICDNRLLVKITEAGKKLLPDYETQLPYEGGSPMFYIEDVENRTLLAELAVATCAELPEPKPRPKKKKKQDTEKSK